MRTEIRRATARFSALVPEVPEGAGIVRPCGKGAKGRTEGALGPRRVPEVPEGAGSPLGGPAPEPAPRMNGSEAAPAASGRPPRSAPFPHGVPPPFVFRKGPQGVPAAVEETLLDPTVYGDPSAPGNSHARFERAPGENPTDAPAERPRRRSPRHRAARLSDAEIVDLLAQRAAGVGVLELARRFKLSRGYASKLCRLRAGRAVVAAFFLSQETGTPFQVIGPSGECSAQEVPAEHALSTPEPDQVAPGGSRRTE